MKRFYDTEINCSAEDVEWGELNYIRQQSTLEYMGNHFDDDDFSVWAVFGRADRRYCVLIAK